MDQAHQAAAPHTLASPNLVTPEGLERVEFQAMGTSVSLLLPEAEAESHGEAVRQLFEEWETTLSRFRPESELSRLNARSGRSVTVSPLLGKVLTTALAAAQASGGIYDPTLLPQLIEVGYAESFEKLPQTLPPLPSVVKPGGGWRDIEVDSASRQVRTPGGILLDFGGIAKGMAVDAAVALLRERGAAQALVNAGGDLRVLGALPDGGDWPLTVEGKGRSWVVDLRSGAMATSGMGRRRWKQGDVLRHHLLNPATGLPAVSGLWSVSVAANTCEQAEVAAKVAFIEGEARGTAFLERHGLSGLFVRDDGMWSAVGAWPAASMRESE